MQKTPDPEREGGLAFTNRQVVEAEARCQRSGSKVRVWLTHSTWLTRATMPMTSAQTCFARSPAPDLGGCHRLGPVSHNERFYRTHNRVEIRYAIPTSPAGEATHFCQLCADYREARVKAEVVPARGHPLRRACYVLPSFVNIVALRSWTKSTPPYIVQLF